MIIEGKYSVILTGSELSVAEQMIPWQNKGYHLSSASRKTNWPFFWQKKWTVKMAKDVIVDDKYIIETPLTELK